MPTMQEQRQHLYTTARHLLAVVIPAAMECYPEMPSWELTQRMEDSIDEILSLEKRELDALKSEEERINFLIPYFHKWLHTPLEIEPLWHLSRGISQVRFAAEFRALDAVRSGTATEVDESGRVGFGADPLPGRENSMALREEYLVVAAQLQSRYLEIAAAGFREAYMGTLKQTLVEVIEALKVCTEDWFIRGEADEHKRFRLTVEFQIAIQATLPAKESMYLLRRISN